MSIPAPLYTLCGLTVQTDTLSVFRDDRVMPILEHEQEVICSAMDAGHGRKLLDIGTGSGVLALYGAANGCDVTGIDVLARAIRMARANAARNGLRGRWILGEYCASSFPECSFDLIVSNPPHHPTPPGCRVVRHADGGARGTAVCTAFLRAAFHQLRPHGKVIVFQLTPSRNGKMQMFEDLRGTGIRPFDARVARVLPTIPNKCFLEGVYGRAHAEWVSREVEEYPDRDLVLAELSAGGSGAVVEAPIIFNDARLWDYRMSLHRQLACDAK